MRPGEYDYPVQHLTTIPVGRASACRFSASMQNENQAGLKPVLPKSRVRDCAYSCNTYRRKVNANRFGGPVSLLDAGADGWAG